MPSSPSRTRSRGRCAPRSTRSRSTPTGVVIVGEHDLSVSQSLIAREEVPLEEIEVVISHPQAHRAVRPLPSREPPRRRRPRSREHCGGGPGRERERTALGRPRRGLRGRALRVRRPPRGRRGRTRQRHPLRLDRPRGNESRRATVLGARPSSSRSSAKTSPGPWSRPFGRSRSAASTSPGSSPARAGAASAATCSSSTARARSRTPRSPPQSRSCAAGRNRSGSSAATRRALAACRGWSPGRRRRRRGAGRGVG